MKDSKDSKTLDLLTSSGAKRQAAYAARMRAAGRKQFAFWLTEKEAADVRHFIEKLRGERNAE